jgi:putative transposase
MYEWRKMTPEQRREALEGRKKLRRPWHGPPHRQSDQETYHLSAACYEHKPIIGTSPRRMADFEAQLLDALCPCAKEIFAWCVLPNHYHVLLEVTDLEALSPKIKELHGPLAFEWNGEERARGRKVWHRFADRAIRSEAHFRSTMNYDHHNPVHHGYVKRWQDWPFSSAAAWLEEVGEDRAAEIWKDYPLLDYGKGWDDPSL